MVLAAAATMAAAPERHVRIVLDTSQSMRGTRSEPANDPSGLALISTAMFYDLAGFELGVDGTFKLRTFDAGSGSGCPSSVPKTATGDWITVNHKTRDSFISKVLGLRYDAPCTYFYPYLAEAARDLETTRSGDDVKRIVVLITDGLTEAPTRAEEERLLGELAPRYRNSHIDLYVLAFGPTARANADQFQRIFGLGTSGGTGGEALADPGGRDLVENMIKIFKDAFAYQSEVVSGDKLDLAGGTRRRAVAVLAQYDPAVEPAFEVVAPAGARGSNGRYTAVGRPVPDVTPKGSGHPISYGIEWVVGPALGEHSFVPRGARPRQVAILRPINVMIRIEPAPPAPSQVAMVDAPMRLNVVVSPADGGKGDPGPVTIQFRALAVKTADGYEYTPSSDWLPSAGGGGFVSGKGRTYEIQPVFAKSAAFSKPPRDGKPYYDGYIEARAQVDGNDVASTPNAHQVRIYPWLSLRPDPESKAAAHGSDKTLEGGQTGCADFAFHLEGAAQNTDYTLSAKVGRADLTGPLGGAEVSFDGSPVKAWENGRKVGHNALGAHNFRACVTTPRRTAGGKDLKIPIHFALWQAEDDPYKQLDVVKPFLLVANIEPAGFLQRWNSLLLLLFTLLILALLYWLLNRIGFPDDLRTAVAAGPEAREMQAAPPSDPGLIGHVTGGGARPVFSADGGREIGMLVPLQQDLYTFRPNQECRELASRQGGAWVEAAQNGDGEFEILARRLYRVRDTQGKYHYFRTEYEAGSRKAG